VRGDAAIANATTPATVRTAGYRSRSTPGSRPRLAFQIYNEIFTSARWHTLAQAGQVDALLDVQVGETAEAPHKLIMKPVAAVIFSPGRAPASPGASRRALRR
jgi:hypothetical protein